MATIQERIRAHHEGDRESLSGIPLMLEAASAMDALVEALEQILAEIPSKPKTALAHVIRDIAIDALSRDRGDK